MPYLIRKLSGGVVYKYDIISIPAHCFNIAVEEDANGNTVFEKQIAIFTSSVFPPNHPE